MLIIRTTSNYSDSSLTSFYFLTEQWAKGLGFEGPS